MQATRARVSSGASEEPRAVHISMQVLFGRMFCAGGLLFAAIGTLGADVSLEVLGILLGTVGYILGARRFGTVTIVLSTVMLLFVLAASQGYVPGIPPTDPLAMPAR